MNIKKIREAAGMTQLNLANLLKIDRSTVAKWESGAAYPRAEQLPTIANALNCSINDLYAKETQTNEQT